MRWIIVCLVVGIGYWYWFGMNQDDSAAQSGSYKDNAMRACMAKKAYAASRLVDTSVRAQSECATELNVYHEDGHWYSYDETRR